MIQKLEDRLTHCLASNLLHLILMPTEQCNFRCTYCYEEFQHQRMPLSVVRGIRRLLSRRAPDLSHLGIAWFGGEPLLALDVVKSIQSHVQRLVAEHPRLRFDSSMTTNGYRLDAATFEDLVGLGVSEYQVSFDGPRHLHDAKRRRIGGQATFERIWRNLEAITRTPGSFRILVRVHIDEENREALSEFLEQYQASFGADPRFQIYFRALGRMGGPNDASLPVLDPDQRRLTLRRAERSARALDLKMCSADSVDGVCYAARGNSFVVRANGELGKCTVALPDPTNRVGRIRPDGTLDIDGSRFVRWIRGVQSNDELELTCPARGLTTANGYGRPDRPTPP